MKELEIRLEEIEKKLERLMYKGSNDEKLVDKKRELQRQIMELSKNK
jgi:hypothetical protein